MYEPTPIPFDAPPGLRQWLLDQVRRIAGVLRAPEVNTIRFVVHNVAPARVADGDVYFADGTDWNPGSGRGLYERRAAAWVKL